MKNTGFSLVELLVVIAIMAILAGVAVPVYSTYTENAKIGVDENFVAEIFHAAEIEAARIGDTVVSVSYNDDATAGAKITVVLTSGDTTDATAVATAVKNITGEAHVFESNEYEGKTVTYTKSTDAYTKA